MPPGNDRPRREDIIDAGDYLPLPDLTGGQYLVDYLFRIGPVKKDGPLGGPDIESWQRLLGIEWEPWEAEALYRMSQAYLQSMHDSVKHDAPPPWEEAVPMWQWVRNQRAERALDKFEKRQERLEKRKQKGQTRNGDRQ